MKTSPRQHHHVRVVQLVVCDIGIYADVVVMLHQDIDRTSGKMFIHALEFCLNVLSSRTVGDISPYSARHSANIQRGKPKSENVAYNLAHVADISAMLLSCSCRHRRCITVVMKTERHRRDIGDQRVNHCRRSQKF